MEMESCQNIDTEFEADGLIDGMHFSGRLNTEKEGDNSLLISETDHCPEMLESTEPQQNQRKQRYNLRKSLAWDSAFFSSAGVLDAEELSTMLTRADKGEKHMLPGIQEEITGSTESLSTLGSDTLTLESLEDNLFLDIRASIQRSSKKALSLRTSNSKAADVEVDSTDISSLKQEDLISQNTKQKPCLKKTSSLQTVRMSKCQPKQNIGKVVTGKAAKQESVHSKIGGASSIILSKPPKTVSSSIPSSAAAGKQDSVGTGRAKSGISNSAIVPAKATQPPKAPSLGGARRILPKPAPSPSSSLLSSSTTTSVQSRRSSTSSDSSSTISSKINPYKPTNPIPSRRNITKTSNIATTHSVSISKTPSRATPKTKLPSPFSKFSSNISPASSTGEWSSASSSPSSSMVNKKFGDSRNSVDTSSCRSSIDGDLIPLDRTNPLTGRTGERIEYDGVILTNDDSKKMSPQSGGKLHAPGKPSGLRLPSHKFGFFDGVKSSVKSPSRHHPHSPSVLNNGFPKTRPSIGIPVRSSNSKLKTANKASTPKVVTTLKPTPSHDKKSTTDTKNSSNSPVTALDETCRDPQNALTEDRSGRVLGDTGEDRSINENGYSSNYLSGVLTSDEYEKRTHENFISPIDGLVFSNASESETCRVPLAPKNCFVSSACADVAKEPVSSACADVAKEPVVEVADKVGSAFPAFEQKENC